MCRVLQALGTCFSRWRAAVEGSLCTLASTVRWRRDDRDGITETISVTKWDIARVEGIDLVAANRMTQQALLAVGEKRLGYALVCAARPERGGAEGISTERITR
jgi:hypothetical protein